MIVKLDNIRRGLAELGLREEDTVIVHASLSSFGQVEGGADTVVDAILAAIGDSGTLLAPTFNSSPGIFDPNQTPSQCGAVSEAVRNRPCAIRSLHPTHSVAAIGPLARMITEGHENVHAFGRGSPLFKMLQARGKILQLGTSHTTNSMIHVAEEIAAVGYLDRSQPVQIRTPRGRLVTKWIRRPGCSLGFDKIEGALQDRAAVRQTMIGKCRARLIDARAVVDAAVEALKMDPEALLCSRPECGTCAEARAVLDALQSEAQDSEITRMAEDDERTVRMLEERLSAGPVRFYDPEDYEHSPN